MSSVEALQTTLAGEHAALFVVGYLGGQTSQSGSPGLYLALRESYSAHRDRRDRLEAMLVSAGATPRAAAPSYDLPDIDTARPTTVAAAALDVERACGVTYGFLVANTVGDERAWAVDALLDSAGRELELGGRPQSFPGR